MNKHILFLIVFNLIFLSHNNAQNITALKKSAEQVDTIAKSNLHEKYYFSDSAYNKEKPESIFSILSSFGTRNHFKAPKSHRYHAWRIKSGEKIKAKDRNIYNRFAVSYLSNIMLSRQKNSISVYFPNTTNLRKLFKNRKDGLCLEFITFKDYKSDSVYYTKPARRNGACIFNGTVPKPIYKKKINNLIRKQNKRKRKRKSNKELIINFGKIPKKLSNDLLDINLIVLKKNRIIDIIPFLNIYGGYLNYPIYADTIPVSFHIRDVENPHKPEFKTLRYKINFERDKTIIDKVSINRIKKGLNTKGYKPVYVSINSYASIEGTEEHNKILFKQRAKNLIKIINENTVDSFPMHVNTEENWKLFTQQITNTKYNFLKNSTKDFVKRFLLLDQPLIDLDKQLKQQRYVSLQIVLKEIVTEKKQIRYALKNYISIFNKNNEKTFHLINNSDRSQLSDLQHFIFKKIIENKIGMDALDTLPTIFAINKYKNQEIAFWQLEIDKLSFELVYNKSLTLNDKYELLKKLSKINGVDPLITINYYIMSVADNFRNQLKSPATINEKFNKRYNKKLENAEKKIQIPYIKNLRLFYHINKLSYEYKRNNFSQFKRCKSSLKYVYNYFSDTTINENYRFDACKFFVLLHKYKYASKIISNICVNGTTNKEIIHYYSILYFGQNHSLTSDCQFLFDLSTILNKKEWCELFTGRNRIGFKIMDYSLLRDFYFDKCGCNK